MKTKKVKVSGKPFSSRTVIGIVCIVLAFTITFGVAPLVNRFTDRKVDIVRLKSDVGRGQIITANDIEIVNVGAHNLPSSVIKDSNTVVGKYAATDLYAGAYKFCTSGYRRALLAKYVSLNILHNSLYHTTVPSQNEDIF